MTDDPMDEGDIAADYQARHNKDAIAKARSRMAGPQSGGPAAENCEWCGAEIPAARRQAVPGCAMCIECQTIKERLKNGL